MIKLIIGLGNPGKEYENTYHNVGFWFVDYALRTTNQYEPTKVKTVRSFVESSYFVKSNAYMNQSGSFVARELKKRGLKPEALLIVHDDSDIELGKFKLSLGRGAAGHKGAENVIRALKTKNFWRFRIGVRPAMQGAKRKAQRLKAGLPAEARAKAGEFVLKKITAAHARILERVFEEGAKKLFQSIQSSR